MKNDEETYRNGYDDGFVDGKIEGENLFKNKFNNAIEKFKHLYDIANDEDKYWLDKVLSEFKYDIYPELRESVRERKENTK